MMDDSFRVRADKAFGSLPGPWSVTGDEVERREWKRGKDAGADDRDQTPCSSSFLEQEWGIKASIGMDPTLDREEEEDEYDKVAAGTEGVDDERLFMDEVSHHGSYLNSHNVLHGSKKDSRADSLAAKLRLKEDNAEARKPKSTPASAPQVKEEVVRSPRGDRGGKLKSILKRKAEDNDGSVGKAQKKRVRFDLSCVNHCDSSENDSSSNVNGMVSDNGSVLAPRPPTASKVLGLPKRKTTAKVPDYLVNPSKYTRYSFDTTSKVVGGSNTRPSTDYLTQVDSSNSEARSEVEDAPAQLPKFVPFVPKEKRGDGNAVNDSDNTKHGKEDDIKYSLNRPNVAVGIAAVEVQTEVIAVEEGSEPNAARVSASLKKSGRKYRPRPVSDDDSDS